MLGVLRKRQRKSEENQLKHDVLFFQTLFDHRIVNLDFLNGLQKSNKNFSNTNRSLRSRSFNLMSLRNDNLSKNFFHNTVLRFRHNISFLSSRSLPNSYNFGAFSSSTTSGVTSLTSGAGRHNWEFLKFQIFIKGMNP